jgi:hypothetical protein
MTMWLKNTAKTLNISQLELELRYMCTNSEIN